VTIEELGDQKDAVMMYNIIIINDLYELECFLCHVLCNFRNEFSISKSFR